MQSSSNENKIIMALQAINQNLKLSIKRASQIYEVPRTTLINRRDGIQSKCDISSKSKNLTDLKKKIIFEHIIDLINCSFLLRQDNVRNIANLICEM